MQKIHPPDSDINSVSHLMTALNKKRKKDNEASKLVFRPILLESPYLPFDIFRALDMHRSI
jgi:hypothetical protein